MANQNNDVSKENEMNPQRNLNPNATSYGGGDEQNLETGSSEGTEVNPGELGNNNEVDLDRSGPNEDSGESDKASFDTSAGSAGSDTNRNAGGDVAGRSTGLGKKDGLKH
jgi:hypothetical protein